MDNTEVQKEGNQELIEFRLSNIEKILAKLEARMESDKLQDRDIEDLKKKYEMLENAFNAHDQRLRTLETAPVRAKAEKWTTTLDTVYKLVLTACVLIILAKVGLQ